MNFRKNCLLLISVLLISSFLNFSIKAGEEKWSEALDESATAGEHLWDIMTDFPQRNDWINLGGDGTSDFEINLQAIGDSMEIDTTDDVSEKNEQEDCDGINRLKKMWEEQTGLDSSGVPLTKIVSELIQWHKAKKKETTTKKLRRS